MLIILQNDCLLSYYLVLKFKSGSGSTTDHIEPRLRRLYETSDRIESIEIAVIAVPTSI